MLNWFYRISLILALVLVAFTGYFWYQSNNDSDIQLILKSVDNISSGRPFDLNLAIANNSEKVLTSAKLILILPEGLALLGEYADKNIITRSLGDIGVGSLNTQEFKILAVNTSSSAKTIEINLVYNLNLTGPQFEQKQTFDLLIGEPAIDLKVELPEQTSSNDDFEIKISYKNISDIDFNNLKLKVDYPPVFKFKQSTLEPDEEDNVWNLGGLNKNSENKFSIMGNLIAPTNTQVDFKVYLQLVYLDRVYDINEQTVSTIIASSPFDLHLTINGEQNYIARLGENLTYAISFDNPLDNLSAQLNGEMFDWSTLGNNVLNWNNLSSPINFQVKVRDNYPIKRLGDKNFLLKVSAEGRSGKNISVAKSETKVAGQVKVAAKGYFRDAAAGVLNRGSMPPKVALATDFTIHWLLSNYGTDIKNVVVRATLPANIKFSGVSKSSLASTATYDASAHEMVWQIDRILATQGVIDEPIETIFQVTAIPTPVMVSQVMPLLGETSISALDEFTEQVLVANSLPITTALPDDPTVAGQGMVVK